MKAAVIGGGVVGLCSAYSLAEKGFDVVVIDPAEGPRTSDVNAGMIVPSHVIPLAAPGMIRMGIRMMLRPKSPFWIRPRLNGDLFRWGLLFARHCNTAHVNRAKPLLAKLNSASKQAYLDFERILEGFLIEQKGLLMVAAQDGTVEEETHVAEQVRELGLPAVDLDRDQMHSFDPGIRIAAAGGTHYPADCHFSPPVFMHALRRRLETMGVQFFTARAALTERDGTVATPNGAVEADCIVLAAGCWTARLLKPLRIRLPLLAGKGYSFEVEMPPERPSIAAILMEGRVAVTPMPTGVRFGGTMEIGPTDGRIDERRIQGIREAIPRYYPAFRGFDLSSFPAAVGLRPCSPDGLPYVGRVTDKVIVATGHAMMGMSLGPITGRLVAQIATGEQPSIPIESLAPKRFA